MITFSTLSTVLMASAALSLTACGRDAQQITGNNEDHSTMEHRDMGNKQDDTMMAMAMGRVISVD